MNKLGHILFSTLFFTLIYYIISKYLIFDKYTVLFSYIIFIIFSLLPDIDKNNSWIRKQLRVIILFLLLFFTIISIINNDKIALTIVIILIFIELFLTFVKHRGIIHTFSFGIIISIPLFFISPVYFFSAILGFITHLIADSF
jgi:hypothetical protein